MASADPAPWFFVVSVSVMVMPAPTVLGAEKAEMIRSGPWATVRARVVVFVKPLDVPVIVTVTVPTAAVLLAADVNALEVMAGLGLNDAVTPLDRPEADKLTLLPKPFCGVTVIVLVPLAPCGIVKVFGEAASA